MQTVELHVDPAELTKQMATMRNWLDQHRFQPSTFACEELPETLRVCVTFGASGAALAFAARFAGQLRTRPEMPLDGEALSPAELVG